MSQVLLCGPGNERDHLSYEPIAAGLYNMNVHRWSKATVETTCHPTGMWDVIIPSDSTLDKNLTLP